MRIEKDSVGISRVWLLTLTLAVGPATMRVHAHVRDVVYPFTEITDDMLEMMDLTDGSIEDWEIVVGEPTLTLLDFTADTRFVDTPERDPGDLDLQVWLGWHGETGRLWFGVQVIDDVYIGGFKNRDNDFRGNYDNIGLVVDGDHSGGEFFSGNDLQRNRQAQIYLVVPEAREGDHLGLWTTSNLADWMVKPPYAESGGIAQGENPVVYVVEFAVTPFDRLLWNDSEESVASDLSAGKVIGFDLVLTDTDTKPGNLDGYYRLVWAPEFDPTADGFGDGLLLPADGETGDDSVVESITWARIKAALQD